MEIIWGLLIVLVVGFLIIGPILGIISFVKIQKIEHQLFLLKSGLGKTTKPAAETLAKISSATKVTKPITTKPSQPSTQKTKTSQTNKVKPVSFARRIERSLSGNWLVWVAGIVLAFGGIFIVQVVAQAGLLGPAVRVGLAGIVGVLMLGFAHKLRRQAKTSKSMITSAAPQVLAGAGLTTLYGAIYASFALYSLIGPVPAFLALAVIAALGVYQAAMFGPIIAVFGLVGAFIAPGLIGSDNPSAITLFSYVFVVSVAGLVLARLRPWRWNSILALAGGLGWPLLWLLAGNGSETLWVLQIYLPALAAVTLSIAWQQAGLAFIWRGKTRSHLSLYSGLFAIIGTGLLLFFTISETNYQPSALIALFALALMAIIAAYFREGFSLGAAALAVITCLMLALWPSDKSILVAAPEQLSTFLSGLGTISNGPSFLTTSFGFAALFGFGGYLASLPAVRRAILVYVSAIIPLVILFLAYWRLTDFDVVWPFAAAALTLAIIGLILLEKEAKADRQFTNHPGVGATLSLGVSGAVLLVFLILLSQMWLSLAFSAQALISTLLWKRFKLPALQWAAMALAAIASFRLLVLGEAFDFPLGAWPIFNGLLFGFGGSSLLLVASGFMFIKSGVKVASAVVQSLFSAAFAIGVAMLSLQIHHLMAKGDLTADIGFAEIGLQISMYALIALSIRFFLGSQLNFAPKWTERVALIVSGFGLLFIASIIQNPWWGWDSVQINGGFLFNALALVFLIPAILFAAIAFVFRSQNKQNIAKWFSIIAGLGGFLWMTLEVRRAFHAPNLSTGSILDTETYIYSASWLVFAVVLLGLGFWQKREALRISGLVLLAITSIKVFIFDLSGLDGLLRGLSFLGLGGSLMVIALLYQRFGGVTIEKEAKS